MAELAALFRDTPLGQLVRRATKGRLLKYPDEQPGFKLPERYHEASRNRGSEPSSELEGAQEWIIVDWYSDEDKENPQNWSAWKKAYLHLSINIYTFAIYMSSSIYTPAAPELIRIYGISNVTASLGLGLYVLGYGLGPLVFGPPSEIASIGRNPVYVTTLVLFVVLSIPTALADNIPGFMILRFLQGFFGSPGLANGGGSISDITAPLAMPYALYLWAFFPLAGPSVGPMIAGFSVPAKNWRWSMWEILWISSFSLVNMVSLILV